MDPFLKRFPKSFPVILILGGMLMNKLVRKMAVLALGGTLSLFSAQGTVDYEIALAAGLNGVPAKYAEYAGWEVVADKGLPMGGPHPGPGKVVYANPVAAKDWKSGKPLALGSIVVKTAGPASAPTLLAVMEKRQSGWYYEEYFLEGGKYLLKFGGPNNQGLCVGCHTRAKAKDYLFTRP